MFGLRSLLGFFSGATAFVGAFSYSNIYGQGDRTGAGITINSSLTGTTDTLINGSGTDLSCKFSSTTGQSIEFVFPTEIELDQMTWDQGSNVSHNTWKCQGKLNSGDTYVDISANFTFTGTAGSVTMTSTPRLKYFKLVQVSGNASTTPFLQEFTFRTRNS